MNNNIDLYKKNLYSAVIADTLDSLGYHKQVLTPGITSLDPNIKICGLARVGLYMPIYHDDENAELVRRFQEVLGGGEMFFEPLTDAAVEVTVIIGNDLIDRN